jgi:hypothetical protein
MDFLKLESLTLKTSARACDLGKGVGKRMFKLQTSLAGADLGGPILSFEKVIFHITLKTKGNKDTHSHQLQWPNSHIYIYIILILVFFFELV